MHELGTYIPGFIMIIIWLVNSCTVLVLRTYTYVLSHSVGYLSVRSPPGVG